MKRYINVIIWTVIIVVLSLLPKDTIDSNHIKLFKGADKIVHFVLYAILMILWFRIKRNEKVSNSKRRFITFGATYSISLGIILEILQNYLEIGRSFDTFDIVADILGVLIIVIIFYNQKF